MMPGDEQITIVVDDAEVEATVNKIEIALGKKEEVDVVRDEADQTSAEIDDVTAQGPQIRGTSMLARRTIAQIPQIREAYHLTVLTNLIMRANPLIAIILLAWMSGRAIIDYLEGQAKQFEDYRQMIMEAKGYATMSQVDAFIKADKANTSEAYRSSPPL